MKKEIKAEIRDLSENIKYYMEQEKLNKILTNIINGEP